MLSSTSTGGSGSTSLLRQKAGTPAATLRTTERRSVSWKRCEHAGQAWIVFPTTSFWWLDHYSAFHQHLARTYTAVPGVEDDCLVFRLDGN